MFRWRSIRTRLTLLFFAITLAAVGFVCDLPHAAAGVVAALREAAARWSRPPTRTRAALNNPFDLSERQLNSSVRAAAERTSTRVTLLSVRSAEPPDTYVISDSNQETDISDVDFSTIADQAVEKRTVVSGTATTPTTARSARRPSRCSPASGCGASWCSPRRWPTSPTTSRSSGARSSSPAVWACCSRSSRAPSSRAGSRGASSRLEEGARRVSRGDFSTRFPEYDDELGSLSQALDDMQGQLAQLDSARKRFIATASHELRTPLFSLGGLPRAARGRGPRRGHAPRVHPPGAPADAAPAEARDRPARPLAAGGRVAGAAPGADRRRLAHPRPSSPSSLRRSLRTTRSHRAAPGALADRGRLRSRARRAGAAHPARTTR